MKKMVLSIVAAVSVMFAADAKLFTGSWMVQNEGLTLTFSGKDSVKFSSADEESINGVGKFKFTENLLSAKLNNEGMVIDVVYAYKKVGETVKVSTKLLKINGEVAQFSKAVMTMVRPKAKTTAVKAEPKKTETKSTTTKK